MQNKRRKFLKLAGLTGMGVAGSGMLKGFASEKDDKRLSNTNFLDTDIPVQNNELYEKDISIIGLYGAWAGSLNDNKLPALSFRRNEFKNVDTWRKTARQRVIERLSIPDIGGTPKVTVNKQYSYDGLNVEELTWQLPYGRPTEAILLKPINAKGKLPGILAFHDHGGNKYFGCQKITRTSDDQLKLMKDHQEHYYSGYAWANEIAKRGYVVLVSDAFTFASRRVKFQDVPERLRNGHTDTNQATAESVQVYNDWAGEHEHVMAKSLFCAGTTWPAVFFAEDQKALDILCAREDVDADKVGCGGLSGGGLRTVFMAGLEARIKCAVDVGFTTTWRDFILNRSYTHTWMTYVPVLPNELDFPEILGLRAPLPTLVLNDSEDQLYTLPEMKRAEQILSEVYKKAGAADKFKCSYYPGKHKFDSKMQEEAFNWFDRWLKA
jgi:dienelactone hydrolase